MEVKKAFVLGDGAWGTAIAILLSRKGISTTIWGAFPDYVREVSRTRENVRFLPGVLVPGEIGYTSEIEAGWGADMLLLAVPTQHMRSVLSKLPPAEAPLPVVSLAKGIEQKTLLRPDEIVRSVMGKAARVVVVSGPSHAEEVAVGIPTSVVAAGRNPAATKTVQDALSGPTFRAYRSADVVGVGLGGALKNVIAIAAGIADGLGFGDNTKAALITRGIREIARLGTRMGGRAGTFAGLSGIGDLIVTCASRHSRNRALGEMIGRGASLEEALESTPKIAEGVWTSKAVVRLSGIHGVEMPISREVNKVLFGGRDARKSVASLMARALKAE